MAAYHTICTKCAVSDAAISAMEKHQGTQHVDDVENPDTKEEDTEQSNNPAEQQPLPSQESITNENRIQRPRKIKVCAMCTHEPALSKYDNMPPEASELVSQIQELEEALDSGMSVDDGHKLTLREVKTVERQLEKLKLEIKEFGKKKEEDCDEDDEEGGEDDNGDETDEEEENESNDSESEEDEDDPFLKAVGGKDKLLVGEEYQKMLLAKELQKSG